MTAGGIRSGTIEGRHKYGYIVRLDNGKLVVVYPDSFIKENINNK